VKRAAVPIAGMQALSSYCCTSKVFLGLQTDESWTMKEHVQIPLN